jgi:ligand-binding sensor domain-containing protein/serine phosphatase RsbU (regulator of sigma subunit)
MGKSLIIFMLCLFSVLTYSQNNIRFDRISIEQGLSQNTVYAICQDSDGFIWFGTYDGLNKYDGYKITVFRNDPDNPQSLPDNAINTIFVDSDGLLWVGTNSGVCCFDKAHNRFVSYNNSKKKKGGISNNIVTSFFEDHKGNLWVGTNDGLNLISVSDRKNALSGTMNFRIFKWKDGLTSNKINKIVEDNHWNIWIATDMGLSKFDYATQKIIKYNYQKTEKIRTPENIITLYFDKYNTLWIGTDHGLQKKDANGRFIELLDQKEFEELNHHKITSISEDSKGILWIGTEASGIFKFNKKTKKLHHLVSDATDKFSLSVDHILCIYHDGTDMLWIGTYLGGINKWDRTSEGIDLFRHNPYSNSLSSSQIRSIFQDKEDTIWVGTVDGGLNKWNLETNTFTAFTCKENDKTSLGHNHVRSIAQDRKGNLWVGTDGGGLNKLLDKKGHFKRYLPDLSNPGSISSSNVWEVFIDSKDRMWVGTSTGGLNLFDTETEKFVYFKNDPKNPYSISDNHVTTIFEDKEGTIWVGTFGGGLNKWNGKGNDFKHYRFMPGNAKSIGNDRIYSIFQDSKGRMWIGTKGNLNLFDQKNNTFTRYTDKNGLPNNVIMGILEDKNKNLWLSTNNGIAKFNPETGDVKTYDIKNGLQSNEFLVGAYCRTRQGKMLFGGINGLNYFSPEVLRYNQHPPRVVPVDFKLLNESVEPSPNSILVKDITQTEEIVLPWDENFFSFDFVVLHYSQPFKNKYCYKLEGLNSNWIKTDATQRTASFTNVEPGTYFFKVKGANSDGVWNEEGFTIKITILPPFWKTLWFRVLAILVIIGNIYYFYRRKINLMEAHRLELERQVRERTAEIEQQKEEIMTQRDQLEVTNKKVEQQNENIKGSIRYAKTIQQAILPTDSEMADKFESFVIYRPKDIVSGDFYWFATLPAQEGLTEKIFFAVVDCTGHGVPGAFMSMIGNRLLNEIVMEKKVLVPSKILELLNVGVINALKQHHTENNDGMDVSLVRIEKTLDGEIVVSYAGAKNSLFFYSYNTNELQVIKADRKSLGGVYADEYFFTRHDLPAKHGDQLYLTSDGIIDQNGPDRKRFGTPRFTEMINANAHLPLSEQKVIFEQMLDSYMQDEEQRDDITVVGIRIR